MQAHEEDTVGGHTQALIDPYPEQIIEISEETLKRAAKSLDEMFRLAE